MSAPATTTPPEDDSRAKTLRGLLLANELDASRQARGFTTRTLAAGMAMSPAMLNRIMTGRRVPDALEIGGLCALLDIPHNRRPTLYERARTTHLTDWVIHPRRGRNPVRDVEDFAHTITWFEPHTIPNPLRTTAYDHDIPRPTTPDHAHSGKATLTTTLFLIHPRTLTNPGLPAHTHREQLHHLLDNNLDRIRLLPEDTASQPGFRVLELTRFPPIVHISHHRTDILLEDLAHTNSHTDYLTHIKTIALTSEDTRDALLSLIQAS